MFLAFILVFILKCTHAQKSFTSISCSPRTPKIIGGTETAKFEMPFMVSLIRRGGHFCGASIIHERWLVTAGHCLCNGLNQLMKPKQIQGVVGLHSISQYINGIDSDYGTSGPLQVNFKTLIPHPQYECTNIRNDIALIELLNPIHFTSHIQPTCLSLENSKNSHENDFATVSGWGWTNENQELGQRADILRKAIVRIWSNSACELSYSSNGNSNRITDSQMCAGVENGGIDSCWADSGGPLMSKENLLIGVVSTGIGCGRPGLPGIYTRISKFIPWIENVLSANNLRNNNL